MTHILGIETSCDETAFAILRLHENGYQQILSNCIHSQHDLHKIYGGVVPELASRAQLEYLTPLANQALQEAHLTWQDIDVISVGNRPGLIGSLLAGVQAAKTLAWILGKPLIAIDHVHAHLAACWIEKETPPQLPALGIVVSGGHTVLFDVNNVLEIQRIGSTIDDAIGEAYDKAAKMLDAGYPGGQMLDKLAQQGDKNAIDKEFPISMLKPDSLDFSFSGLKTSLLYAIQGKPSRVDGKNVYRRNIKDLNLAQRANLAAAFQHAATEAIVRKCKRAIKQKQQSSNPYQSIIIGGGVSANSALRNKLTQLAQKNQIDIHLPDVTLCGDNGAMIASLAAHKHLAGQYAELSTPAIPTTGV